LVEDLGLDSLDLIEFMTELEETFNITISDQLAQQFFVGRPSTLGTLTDLVLHCWGNRKEARQAWWQRPPVLLFTDSVPFTQLGGRPSLRDWLDGQLYESLGRNREGHAVYRRRTDGMRCIHLPEAEAWIGSDEPEGLPDQRPLHQVRVRSFLMDAEPVSNLAFARFLNAVGDVSSTVLQEWCGLPNDDRRRAQFPLRRGWRGWRPAARTEQQPMILVSWYGANAYALWANRRDWRAYRGDKCIVPELEKVPISAAPPLATWLYSSLPSEAQWEYSARGTEPRRFPWGDEDPTAAHAHIGRHATGTTYSADDLPAANVSERLGMSPFGLHHMAGNVWQWCRDWYAPHFYGQPEARELDPQNGQPTGIRNERGGSWVGPEQLARCAYRRGRPPAVRGRCLGFRCVGLPEDLP
jgi:formylglycine-generating enzyme required for sulfatase activity